MQKPSQLPLQCRDMPVISVNEAERTVELVWSTGAAVRRYDWRNDEYYDEVLSLDPLHVQLDRLNRGAPLLNSHNRWDLDDQIGVVEKAWIDGNEARALVRFSARADVEPYWQDVKSGIVRNVSVGYTVKRVAIERSPGQITVWRVVEWEPMELSLVPIPADAGAGVRSAEARETRTYPVIFNESRAADPAAPLTPPATRSEETPMDPQNTPTPTPDAAQIDAARAAAAVAERQRISEIRTIVRAAKLPDDVADQHIDQGTGIDAVRKAVLDKLAAADAANQQRGGVHFQTLSDETENRREAMVAALMHRTGQRADLPENAREFRARVSLLELARYSLDKAGVDTRYLDANQLAMRALHSTSDFSIALGNTVGRTLRQAYDQAPRTFTAWAREGRLSDFRAANRVQVGGAFRLEKIGEGGEYKRGKMDDSGESIKLETYGKVIGITRKVIINDDLDMLGRIPVLYANGAATMESNLVYAALTGNTLMADGVALFHADHKNLAGTGSTVATTSLAEARAALRKQTDPSSKEPLNLVGKTLLVPAAIELAAEQFVFGETVPQLPGGVNPFKGKLQLVVEPRLDAISTTAWYMIADYNLIDTIEYAYLDSAPGLQVATRSGFEVDGIEIKAFEDFAVKAIDHRGLYKNPGA